MTSRARLGPNASVRSGMTLARNSGLWHPPTCSAAEPIGRCDRYGWGGLDKDAMGASKKSGTGSGDGHFGLNWCCGPPTQAPAEHPPSSHQFMSEMVRAAHCQKDPAGVSCHESRIASPGLG
ncbi:hypothetical protein GGTG_06910 [Gaeumannomyces tritici R3-111a-1]|uniref:Uncharacterized protein n=1 Tax=Gaeumannomyces tritici (strain R3-111a-1) TaxID=644352 RepID=J3P063_GAET3|nr:hypothetical protein GGTG_06910 [Gaeumannomyces tritici R3-111a-1]EJT76996.1 hypothetical protein GGTG_06910 [Gaeumannomyces tritici R3-111a-1]